MFVQGPWNAQNIRSRDKGLYYEKAWTHGTAVKPDFISVTSFNEWHEVRLKVSSLLHLIGTFFYVQGTQIEPAKMSFVSNTGFTYESEEGVDYIEMTRRMSYQFNNCNN
jgi:glycoprotein endo-alpha-1,2-mannosidase